MNIEALKMVSEYQDGTAAEKVILYTLAMIADDIGAVVVSHAQLSARTGLARYSVTRALGRLKRAGVLTTEHTPHHHGVRQPDTIFLENFRGAK